MTTFATTLLLGLDRAGRNHLSVLNRNWSIKPKDKLALTFRLSRGGYVDQAAVGMASDGKRGFVTTFEMRLGFLTAASAFSAFAWISAAPSTITITGATAGTELAAVAAAWPSGFTPTTVSVDKAGPGWVIDTKMVA